MISIVSEGYYDKPYNNVISSGRHLVTEIYETDSFGLITSIGKFDLRIA